MSVRINEAMNLVIPIVGRDDEVIGYVHSLPLSRSAFEAHYRLLSLTFAELLSQGYGELAGPRVAALILRDIAKSKDIDPEPLLNEMRRLTCFIRPGAAGWEQVPFQEAVARKMIDEDDAADVLSAIVFFTVGSVMLPKNRAGDILNSVMRIWGASLSPFSPSGLIASLTTSIATDSSGATEQSASPPEATASVHITV